MTNDTKRKITKWYWLIIALPIVLLTSLLLCVWAFADIPSFDELESPSSKLATQVLADDGSLLCTFHIENRSYVSYEELSPYLVQAAIATEDKRYKRHSGIDIQGLGRVAVKTVLLGKSSQGGGSTITQQLAKTLYPREDLSGSFPGVRQMKLVWTKLKEWVTAIKLERCYTKEEIIDMYLNAVAFGSNAFGIKAASYTFFSKAPEDLTIQEAATLIGMINKPTRYNPRLNPEKSLARRNHVLNKMEESDFISKQVRDSLKQLPIELNYQVQDHNAGLAPYFRDMLRRTMNAQKPKRSAYKYIEDYRADSLLWENDALYGWLNKNLKADGSKYNLDRDGLKIYTTINYKMQKYAEEAVAEHLGRYLQKAFDREIRHLPNRPFSADTEQKTADMLMTQARKWSDRWRMMKKGGADDKEILQSFNEKTKMRVFAWNKQGYADTTMTPNDSIRYYKSLIRAAFLAVEPVSGDVKAYVGGPNYRYLKYDNIRQGKRQVGSTIKPFLYTLAMQEGMSPCDRVINVPQTFNLPDTTWTPKSTDKDEWIGQSVTLKWGLMKSSNNISAYLMKQFGPVAMVDMMRRMGISSRLDPVYSLCVGSCDLSLWEMVPAYNTFPSKGVWSSPLFVTSIEDNMGNVLSNFNNIKKEAISEHSAYLMENLMEGVVNNGTAIRLRATYNIPGAVAGKTGTNNDQADGGFIGYTTKITAGAWVGAEDRQVHFKNLREGGGSNMALPIWGIFLRKCMADSSLDMVPEAAFPAPASFAMNLDCGEDIRPAGNGQSGISAVSEEDDYNF